MNQNGKPMRSADATLLDKITSEEAALEVHRTVTEDGRMRMILIFLGVMALMTLAAGAIPAIGFDNAWKVTGPVIGVGAGLLVGSPRRST